MANDPDDDILPPLTPEDKMMAGLCYPFWGMVPFFVLASSKRHDPFLLFHALQGLAVGLVTTLVSLAGLFLLWISFSSLPTSYTMTSGLIGVFLLLAALAFGAFSFALSIFLGWQASSGRFLRMLGVGDLCESRMAAMLDLTPSQLRSLAVDRALVPEEKVVIIQAVSTPEQMEAEMERWAQPAEVAKSWWGGAPTPAPAQPQPSHPRYETALLKEPSPSQESVRPVAPPPRMERPRQEPPPRTGSEVKPWKPAQAHPTPAETREVKPWRPTPANPPAPPTPAARPVSFPSVSRSEPEEKKKWWAPKES